jgi:hypothetical protein
MTLSGTSLGSNPGQNSIINNFIFIAETENNISIVDVVLLKGKIISD